MPINSLDPKADRTICIAGASGFLGRAAVEKFSRHGYKVIALIRPTSKSIIPGVNSEVKQIRGTIQDWVAAIAAEKPSSVLSFDWSGVERELRNDLVLQESNIDRVSRLAAAAVLAGATNFVSFGSQAEVRPSKHPILESALDDPQSAYGSAKIAARNRIAILLEGTDTRFTWGRIFTIYGPGDARESLITQLIKSLLQNESFAISEPSKRWSFLEINDFADAIYVLNENPQPSGIINIGNSNFSTIGEVADKIGKVLGLPRNILKSDDKAPESSQLSWIPDTSTLSSLSWAPRVPLDAGLENTVRWWKQLIN